MNSDLTAHTNICNLGSMFNSLLSRCIFSLDYSPFGRPCIAHTVALVAVPRPLLLNECLCNLVRLFMEFKRKTKKKRGGTTLLLITQGVLHLHPWYLPRYLIPLAGMIFANAMNSVSLAAERFEAEIKRDVDYDQARNIALRASLIPIINSLFAVGLVSLPGMMTGQILSGISPLIAVRYQIMVMCMIFGAAGISSACFLTLVKNRVLENK